MSNTPNDMESVREELRSQSQKNGIHESTRPEVSTVDEGDLMDVSESEPRLLVIDRETQELCQKLTVLVAADCHDIPNSRIESLYNLCQALSLEIESRNLIKMKVKQQKKALQNKISLLDFQIKLAEEALKGVQKRQEEIENGGRGAPDDTRKLLEECTKSRELLHEVIDKLYPNDEGRIKDLLKDLTLAHFSGEENKWVDVRKHSTFHVEQLLQHRVIETKPDEPHLARFCI